MTAPSAARHTRGRRPATVVVSGKQGHGTVFHSRPLAWGFGLGVLAFVLRALGLRTANDVFIDEVTYASLADQVAQGHLPSTEGQPFFLHPPASFALNGLVIKLFGLSGDAMDLALQLRWVNAVLGTATVVVAYFLVRRLAGPVPALLAGLVLVADPFVLRMDGRVMIETPAGLAVLAGWLLLVRALDREPGPARVAGELPAALLFGIALVCKDMTAAFTLLPLLLATLWKRTLPWATVARMLPVIAISYLGYLLLIANDGLTTDFVDQKLTGVLRMAGVVQETGFNATPDASLVSRLVELVGHFGTSYLLLALCPVVGLVAMFSAWDTRRLIGLYALCAGVLGIYCVVAGAAEEQFGYYVVLAAVLATPVAVLELIARRPRLRGPLVVLAVLFVLVGAVLGVRARTTDDDGLVEARDWMTTNLPADARVGLTSVTGEFALLPHGNWAVWPSLSSLQSNGAQYVLTQSHPLGQGYGYADPDLVDWLTRHARPVFSKTGPTNGDTVVWQLDRPALDAAVAAGLTLPPISGGYS